jgi:excisionase family DNA binding protein
MSATNPAVIDIGAQIDSQLLKPARVAQVLAVSRSKAYTLMQAGTLPTIRIGCSLRVPAKALTRWIEENTKAA